MIGISL